MLDLSENTVPAANQYDPDYSILRPDCPLDVDIDIAGPDAIMEMLAARLFLEDERFPDNRGPDHLSDGYPRSYFNCVPAAYWLAELLNQVCPQGQWTPVVGEYLRNGHAYVQGFSMTVIADVTGDQFRRSGVLLKSRGSEPGYEFRWAMSDLPAFDEASMLMVAFWSFEWASLRDSYRAMAEQLQLRQVASKPIM